MFRHSNYEAMRDTEEARGLGWASIGIGLAELLATKQVQNLLGLEDKASHRGVLKVLGVREVMHGLGILTEDRPTGQLAAGLWSRVAGDMLDTALLGVAATKTKSPARFAVVAASVLAIGAMDLLAAGKVQRHHEEEQLGGRLRRALHTASHRLPWSS